MVVFSLRLSEKSNHLFKFINLIFLFFKAFVIKVVLVCMTLALLFNLSNLLQRLEEREELSLLERLKESNLDYDLAYERPNSLNLIIAEAEKLYLNEKYLRAMKLVRLHPDSKMAVDRATKRPLDETLRALDTLNLDNIEQIRQFVDEYLFEPGIEIVRANLSDWSPIPKYVFELKSQELISFALGLNRIWHDLFKRVDLSKLTNGRVSSHLPMRHGFVVPGGRFLEIYYWDSFWTMEGKKIFDDFLIVEFFIYALSLIYFIYLIKAS